MPANARLSTLAARKRQLVQQAELHRQFIAIEGLQLRARIDLARAQVGTYRWWLVAGAVGLGLVFARRLGVVRWLPMALTAVRVAQKFKG